MISLLKAWWGDAAKAENEFAFDLPAQGRRRPQLIPHGLRHDPGKVAGYFLVGENPTVGHANGRMQRFGLANLEWLVVRDLQMIESATFWKDGPEIATGELSPSRSDGDLLHAGGHARGEGSHLDPEPAASAAAAQGRRAAGEARATCGLLRPRAAAALEARRIHGSARPAVARPDLGRPDARRDLKPERRGGAARDQRHRARTARADRLHGPQGRRFDDERLLDLLRRLRRRGEPGRSPQARQGADRWPPSGAGRGRPTAGSSTTAPSPIPTEAVERAQEARLVGRGPGRWIGDDVPTSRRPSGRTTCRRTPRRRT